MTQNEKRALFNRYKHDILFRQWLPTLGRLSREGWGEEVEIWHEAERALCRLKAQPDLRDMEVELIYSDLCRKYSATPAFSLSVMAVLFTCLADAAPDADKAAENPHAPICIAICAMLGKDKRFLALLDAFSERTRNNQGEKVVLPVTDYIETTKEDVETDETEESASPTNELGMLMQMVENLLKNGSIEELKDLELQLYKLDNSFITSPLIKRIEEQITALSNPRPTTQNVFQNGASQINQSTLQSPTFGTPAANKTLKEK
ncbi:hypothetical protein [Parabacteroides sp.]